MGSGCSLNAEAPAQRNQQVAAHVSHDAQDMHHADNHDAGRNMLEDAAPQDTSTTAETPINVIGAHLDGFDIVGPRSELPTSDELAGGEIDSYQEQGSERSNGSNVNETSVECCEASQANKFDGAASSSSGGSVSVPSQVDHATTTADNETIPRESTGRDDQDGDFCVEIEPATSAVQHQPATSDVQHQPAVSDVQHRSATSDAHSQPATSDAQSQPATSDAHSQPATSDVQHQPATSDVQHRPATSDAHSQPATSKSNSPISANTEEVSAQGTQDSHPRETSLLMGNPSTIRDLSGTGSTPPSDGMGIWNTPFHQSPLFELVPLSEDQSLS